MAADKKVMSLVAEMLTSGMSFITDKTTIL